MSRFTESIVEDAALEWLEGMGYSVAHGPDKQEAATKLVLEQAKSLGKSLGKVWGQSAFSH